MLLRYLRTGVADDPFSKDTYHEALRAPWCFPADEDLRRQAAALGCGAPPGPSLGETLLVSVGDGVAQTVLWRLGAREADSALRAVELKGQAARSCDLARRLVTRDLPFLTDASPLHRASSWSAAPLLVDQKGNTVLPRVLDGPSFGLSLCLAHASLLLDVPVPADVAASAEIHADGSVVEVGGLESKVRLVARGGLGVTRLLVAQIQAGQAERCARDAGRASLRIVPVRGVADALREVFPNLEEAMCKRWEDPVFARASAEVFYRLALASEPVLLSWHVLERSADLLERQLADDTTPEGRTAREQAALAKRIARRHEGLPAVIAWPAEPDLTTLPQARRLALIAHVVQSAADHDDALSRDYVAKAKPLVGPMPERSEGEAKLLGAIGRAEAAHGDYKVAHQTLREAIDTWLALFEEPQMARALCEWLRVAGLIGDDDGVRRARHDWVARLEGSARTDDTSRAFVRLALGRALVQLGQPEEAIEVLCSPPPSFWQLTYEHLQDARWRWLARALRSCGRVDEAADAVAGMRESDQKLLAHLDVALATGRDPAALLDELAQEEPLEAGRLVARAREAGEADVARFVADHYRY